MLFESHPPRLIVGELDRVVLDLNEQAMRRMDPDTEKRMVIIPGASHLFEEQGTLEQAAGKARDWFQLYLR